MAPTTLHLVGFAKPASYSVSKPNYVSSCTYEVNVDPPKNVAGKQCIMSAAYCNYETNKPLSSTNRANLTAFFTCNLNSMWSQLYSGTLTSPLLQPALGVRDLEFGLYEDLGPRIVRIPDGPFRLTFGCRGNNLDNPLTRGFIGEATNISYGTNPYAAITVSGTNNVLTLTPSDGGPVSVAIPQSANAYSTASSMASAIQSVLPQGYGIRTDGNTTETRLTLTRNDGGFSVGGTFATAAGFQGTSSVINPDYIVMTVVLHLSPVE